MGSLHILIFLGQWTNISLGLNTDHFQRAFVTVWFKGTIRRSKRFQGQAYHLLIRSWQRRKWSKMQTLIASTWGFWGANYHMGMTLEVLQKPCIGENVCVNSCQVNLVLMMNICHRTSQARIFPFPVTPFWPYGPILEESRTLLSKSRKLSK